MDVAKLVEGGAYGIAIALILLILIGGQAIIKYLKTREEEHTKCYDKLAKVIAKSNKIAEKSNVINKDNAEVTREFKEFMVSLNGSLRNGVKKAKENN